MSVGGSPSYNITSVSSARRPSLPSFWSRSSTAKPDFSQSRHIVAFGDFVHQRLTCFSLLVEAVRQFQFVLALVPGKDG